MRYAWSERPGGVPVARGLSLRPMPAPRGVRASSARVARGDIEQIALGREGYTIAAALGCGFPDLPLGHHVEGRDARSSAPPPP